MIKRMVTSAVFAGFAAGLLAALLHFAFVQKLILLGEDYETGAKVHFAGVAIDDPEAGHDHAVVAAEPLTDATSGTSAEAIVEPDAHDHTAMDAEAERSPLQRNALTVLFFGLTYAGYALMLAAGFGLADAYGVTITARQGLLWGIAGYAAFQMMPAMGLSPELPGTPAADLGARQIWWVGTALATSIALGLFGYAKGLLPFVAAVVLLAVPHVIGAPELDSFAGVAPPELSAAFAARSLGIGLAVWTFMGWLAGYFWSNQTA